MVGPSYRVFAGIGVEYFWAAGYVVLAGISLPYKRLGTSAANLFMPLGATFGHTVVSNVN